MHRLYILDPADRPLGVLCLKDVIRLVCGGGVGGGAGAAAAAPGAGAVGGRHLASPAAHPSPSRHPPSPIVTAHDLLAAAVEVRHPSSPMTPSKGLAHK